MNSPRHEKAFLVLAAYVIGFTTAFIAFGVGKVLIQNNAQYVASDIVVNPEAVEEAADTQISLILDNSGLRIRTPLINQLLTAKKIPNLQASVIGNSGIPGQHYAIIDAELSRDREYAYFCEQLLETDDTCDSYVYDIKRGILRQVKLDDKPYSSPINGHNSSWSSNRLMTVDGYSSTDPDSPWTLFTQVQ